MTRLRPLQYGLALALLALLVWRADPADIWRHLRGVDYAIVGLALLIDVPIVAAVVLRSYLVVRRMGFRIPARVFVPATVLGYVAGALTPAASGEVLRAGVLRARAGVPMEQGVALVIYERALSVYLLALSTGVMLLIGVVPAGGAVAAAALGCGFVMLPWAFAVAVLPRLPDASAITGLGWRSRAMRAVLGTTGHLRSLLGDAQLLFLWSSITLAVFLISAAQLDLLTSGVANDLGIREAWIAFGGSQLAGIASMLPFGLGVSDGSLAAILRRYGLALEQGGAIVMLIRAVVTLPLTLLGFASYAYLNYGAAGEDEPEQLSPA